MFTKILLPLDGSKAAEEALFWVKQYARRDKSLVVLLQVLQVEYPLKGLPFRSGAAEATRYLQGIERELNFAGVPTKILLRSDSVARTIVETAVQEKCDLITMTSRGASKVVRWLIGGVTQQVMRLSPIPVLIVRPSMDSVHERPRRLLCPQDGSTHAKRILPWAGRLARFHGIPLVILHIQAPGRTSAVPRALSRHAAGLRARGVRASVCAEEGDPADRILKASGPGDLLAMTTHGHGGIKRLILGSIAEKIVHQAQVPVLIYKHRGKGRSRAQDLDAVGLFER